ncbi:hypothetical protein FPV67DRAFT_1102409 [Lyophyllum atratum]|nr:hypothetical protein FPV67DRAFT_1102409 [Lyophyllum atratum]
MDLALPRPRTPSARQLPPVCIGTVFLANPGSFLVYTPLRWRAWPLSCTPKVAPAHLLCPPPSPSPRRRHPRHLSRAPFLFLGFTRRASGSRATRKASKHNSNIEFGISVPLSHRNQEEKKKKRRSTEAMSGGSGSILLAFLLLFSSLHLYPTPTSHPAPAALHHPHHYYRFALAAAPRLGLRRGTDYHPRAEDIRHAPLYSAPTYLSYILLLLALSPTFPPISLRLPHTKLRGRDGRKDRRRRPVFLV